MNYDMIRDYGNLMSYVPSINQLHLKPHCSKFQKMLSVGNFKTQMIHQFIDSLPDVVRQNS